MSEALRKARVTVTIVGEYELEPSYVQENHEDEYDPSPQEIVDYDQLQVEKGEWTWEELLTREHKLDSITIELIPEEGA